MNKLITATCFMLLLITASIPVVCAQGSDEQQNPHRKLTVAVLDAPPFSMKDKAGNWTGFSTDLWRQIARDLKLDYELKETDLVGLLKGIEDKTFDASATGIYVTSARESKFDFTTPFYASNVTIAVNADQQPSLWLVFRSALLNWNFLLVMLLIIFVAVLGGVLLWFLEKQGKSEHYGGKDRKSFARSLHWSVTVLAGKELPKSIGWSTEAPKTLPGRLFGLAWMVVGIMIISLYTASAACVLTSRQLQSVIHSPSDLEHVRVGTVVGSTDHGILEQQNIKHALYNSPLELVEALAQHKIDAAVYGDPILRYYAKNLFNDKIIVLRFSLSKYFVAIPLPANSDLRKPVNNALLTTIESKDWKPTLTKYMGNY